jgi:hypothetical protein
MSPFLYICSSCCSYFFYINVTYWWWKLWTHLFFEVKIIKEGKRFLSLAFWKHFANIFSMAMFCVFLKNQNTFSKLLWIIIKWCKILKVFDLGFDVFFWFKFFLCSFYYKTMTWRNKGLKEFLSSLVSKLMLFLCICFLSLSLLLRDHHVNQQRFVV